ncbi:hypothetical protein Roomu2_00004 [Pseudomonas phage vB_PpuM-Roomu-2]|uniref:Uncharacterized protein n=1 Tax=Pseudomonas phage vB_PpuM-Roomu-2 TaxID=3132621 RepID=A0AAX4N0H7_9CAUD
MTIKAKRKLTDISFEHEGAHVALVGAMQGGAANGHTTLITKATHTIPEAVIEKAKTVTVTMQFPEFLRKFFGLYYEDAEVLSVAMGYGKTEYPDTDAKDWIDQRVESLGIMKSVYRSLDVEKALSELTPEQMLALKGDQEMLEKALEATSGQTIHVEEINMETILKSAHIEAVAAAVEVEKQAGVAAVALVQKSLDEAKAELVAAQEKVAQYEAAAVAQVEKARKDAIAAANVPADQVEELFKSLAGLSEEAFATALKYVGAGHATQTDSDMFVQKGVSGGGESDPEVVDRTTELLKAKYGVK